MLAGCPPKQSPCEATLESLVHDFLAKVTEFDCSRDELRHRLSVVMSPKPVRRLVAVDRNRDFHEILRSELAPHFSLPVETLTVEEFLNGASIIEDSLIVTSLYHLFLSKTPSAIRPGSSFAISSLRMPY